MRFHIRNIIAIIFGSAIMGFGVNYFNIANHLTEGGLTGITLLLKYIFNWDPGITNLIFNIPLLILGWRQLGKQALIYTIVGTLSISFFLSVFGSFRHPIPNDTLLAALYAGVTVGVGLGIVFRYGGTTGGSDIIARLFNKYFGWSIGRTLFLTDFLVIGISLYYLNLNLAMYTLVAVFVAARVIDFVQEGTYTAKAIMIISDHAVTISQLIMKDMGRGATLLKGRGGYTGTDKEVLYCVVSRNEMVRFKNLVHSADPHAFVIVNDVYEVFGEGFTLDEEKNPLKK
ncbi:YitT family protein [Aneurinibacillus sp. Ricciae_BoGa-3]|uniref:YitT family protein n=1 Tax=Aneurinibacillus sp. Ricciae_BoGa-3 TaxID=3022697 RepID=UPI00233FFF42|nr:YitT family protein [Aneurinibacillus sp. Ricciae_BoGa-3]WCK56102.1 YitT family protein [Aneurinibacillus sp. Ricciae_BoGa-3]